MSDKVGLVEVIEALRGELNEAVRRGVDQDVQFPVGSVTLEFQVGVTVDAKADGKLRFWVLELTAGGGYTRETVQTVTLTLDAPVDRSGRPIKVSRHGVEKP